MMFNEKYLVEGLSLGGEWVKFNYYELPFAEVKEKAANILLRTNYLGIRIVKV
tara:strand:+ start:163 stop:321 length:159 start_codon:yes stop_codon:yes gene_type:complete